MRTNYKTLSGISNRVDVKIPASQNSGHDQNLGFRNTAVIIFIRHNSKTTEMYSACLVC